MRGDFTGVDAPSRGLDERAVVGARVEPPQPPIDPICQLRPVFLNDQQTEAYLRRWLAGVPLAPPRLPSAMTGRSAGAGSKQNYDLSGGRILHIGRRCTRSI